MCHDTLDEVSATGVATWFQTFPPYGEYPVGGTVKDAPKDAKFIIDELAVLAIVDNFKAAKARPDWPGLLVDEEHFSMDADRSSAAMAWATDIRVDPNGSIWTKWEFTPKGRELWGTKTLINRSPAFRCEQLGKDYRPVELVSIGMTNTPHFEGLSTLAAARAAEVTNTQGESTTMKEIIAELGLADGATVADILAAVKQLKEKASAAEAAKATAEEEKKKAEAECRTMKCDAFIEANKAKIADVAAAREVYMANPEAAEKFVAACKAPEEHKPQTVLAEAKAAPEIKRDTASCREEMAKLPPSERAKYFKAHKAEFTK